MLADNRYPVSEQGKAVDEFWLVQERHGPFEERGVAGAGAEAEGDGTREMIKAVTEERGQEDGDGSGFRAAAGAAVDEAADKAADNWRFTYEKVLPADRLKQERLNCNTEEVRREYRGLKEYRGLNEMRLQSVDGRLQSVNGTSSVSGTSESTSESEKSSLVVSDAGRVFREFREAELKTNVAHRYLGEELPYVGEFCLKWDEVGRRGMWTVTKELRESTEVGRDFFERREKQGLEAWRANFSEGRRVSLEGRMSANAVAEGVEQSPDNTGNRQNGQVGQEQPIYV